MLEKIIAALATVAAVTFAFMSVDARNKNAALTEKLTAAEYRIEVAEQNLAVKTKALQQALQASVVLQDHLDRTAADAEHWEKVATDLEEKDGADEALNDYERAVLDSLLAP